MRIDEDNPIAKALKLFSEDHPEYNGYAYLKLYDDGSGCIMSSGEEVMELWEFQEQYLDKINP